jgi:two-component system phosphate regulon response regulator PhoB
MNLKIILAEDDLSLGQSLLERLTKESFEVKWVRSLSEARIVLQHDYDLAILDLGLPDGSGFDLAMDVKKKNRPLIIMTAMNSAENRLEAYELGSEEFIPKPFHFRELLLRIHHVMESHSGKVSPTLIELPAGQLDLERMCFTSSEGGMTFFAPKDFRVLQLLIERSPKPVHRDEILDQVWGLDSFPTQRTIDNAIVRIRQTIQDNDGHLVRSVRGVGYQWLKTPNEDNS